MNIFLLLYYNLKVHFDQFRFIEIWQLITTQIINTKFTFSNNLHSVFVRSKWRNPPWAFGGRLMSWGDFKMLVSPWPSRKNIHIYIKKKRDFLKFLSYLYLKGKHNSSFLLLHFHMSVTEMVQNFKVKNKNEIFMGLVSVCLVYIPSSELVMWLYNTRVKRDGKISISSLLFCFVCFLVHSQQTQVSIYLFFPRKSKWFTCCDNSFWKTFKLTEWCHFPQRRSKVLTNLKSFIIAHETIANEIINR